MKTVLIDGVETEVADDYVETPPNNESPLTTQRTEPNADILNAYQQQLVSEARRNADLQRQLDEMRKVPAAPATPEQEKEFFDRPRTATAEIVRQELERQVAPLNNFVAQTQRTNTIAVLKQQMRQMPQQFPYAAQVEQTLDSILAQYPQITPDIVAMAYNQAVGYYIHNGGQLNTPTPTPTPTPNVPTPPHVRSGSAPAPRPVNIKKHRDLNENEKRIARFRNMTDAEYVAWTDGVDSREVAHISDDDIKRRIGA